MLTAVTAYPEPIGGSYDALGLDRTWMTAEGRYGAYGYESDVTNNSRSLVDWETVDWALLQDNCLTRNKHRFRTATNVTAHPHMSLPSWKQRLGLESLTSPVRESRQLTGRTAIVIRTWSTYDYKAEDLVNLRSLIVETTLSSEGKYAVFLLVDFKDTTRSIFASTESYAAALDVAVPAELRSIAVLFDESLLKAWYPKVEEHS